MMKVDCKEGVWFKFISYEFLTLARIFCRVYERYELVPTVTSACDSTHAGGGGRSSLHYNGLGWDWRTRDLKNPKEVADEIRREAQAIDYHYDIVLEKDHIHSEYDVEKKRA